MEEIYFDIPNFEGEYQISNLGNVRGLERTYYDKRGVLNNLKQRVLTKQHNKNGYMSLTICGSKIKRTYFIHQLMAMTFIPNPENKKYVNHINGIKLDNRVENLEWVTQSENKIHADLKKDLKCKSPCVHKLKDGFIARITVDKKREYLGYFKTEELAYRKVVETVEMRGIVNKYLTH